MQEVRGSLAFVEKYFRLIRRTHRLFRNFSNGRSNAGGIITFVAKSCAPDENRVEHNSLVDGRVGKRVMKQIGIHSGKFQVVNITFTTMIL